ncbi:D-ribose pyranase [Phaeobacter sp. HF9A]|uniref:D-ribose pyranase n=1 Tax=Phaeobacter sp. HF9A TaxID=2721561 RepID=UPI001430F8AD|nr:D-ribose pyranase [Phaeobacter sp. HF9A]NIZ12781.1 D-ribose pyranase [Phaeobacter sp. HF9A]
MKKHGILNRDISALVARLGHLDEITICDAGLPCPAGVQVIDLSLTFGKPSLWDVLETLRQELVIEGAIWAHEARGPVEERFRAELDLWSPDKEIAAQQLSHAAFKDRSRQSRAILRSGEITPYANIILISGVAF